MTSEINDTHDPALGSWIRSANHPDTDFPVQNLPFGLFCRTEASDQARIGVAIGSSIVDLAACVRRQLLHDLPARVVDACGQRSLNSLMALGPGERSALRQRLSELLRDGESGHTWLRPAVEGCLVPMADVEMRLPAEIGDHISCCASLHHARNVGRMMRPGDPLPESCRSTPLHTGGRASSVILSGSPVWRPIGHLEPDRPTGPNVGPSRELDFGLAVGFFVGPGTQRGEPIRVTCASDHLFGVCLLNAWSARDAQLWESSARGVLFARSYATSISPWVVTMEALAPFRAPAPQRSDGNPDPLPYLDSPGNRSAGALDVTLEARLASARMRDAGAPPVRLCRTSLSCLYWTPAQLVAALTTDGCPLRPGDLVSTGTLSGPTADSGGSFLELTWRGSVPIELPGGELRRFLEDFDEVTLSGWCTQDGAARIGFGECRGTIVPTAARR